MNRPSHESIWIIVIENLSYVLGETFCNFIGTVTRHDCLAIIPMKFENVQASIEIIFDLLDRI